MSETSKTPTLRAQLESAVIVAGAMITGWAIAWMTLDFGPEPAAAEQPVGVASAEEIDEVERELAALRRELAAQAGKPGEVREIIREVESKHGPADDPEQAPILAEDPDRLSPEEFEQWREAELARQQALFDGFDERLASEERDRDWSPRAEAHIGEVLADMREQRGFASTDLVTSECGSATCRAEFRHDDPNEQRRFLEELVPQPGGEFVQADVRIVRDDDGSLRTEAFFTRHDELS